MSSVHLLLHLFSPPSQLFSKVKSYPPAKQSSHNSTSTQDTEQSESITHNSDQASSCRLETLSTSSTHSNIHHQIFSRMTSATPAIIRISNATMDAGSSTTGDPHVETLESLTKGVLALMIISTLIQLATLILMFPVLRKKKTTGEPDPERGIELQDRTANSSTARPRVQERENGGPSSNNHANRATASEGWTIQGLRAPSPTAHTDPYVNAQSRWQEQQARPSGSRGQQTYGRDYSNGGRESRFAADTHQSHNSNNNVNYGRKGNRFAHGT